MSDIAVASSVLLSRGPGSQEVYAVRRAESLRFFGGFVAFPGGKAAPSDQNPDPLRATAARELFEETGVLLARRPDGSVPPADSLLADLRRELLAERLEFNDLLSRLNARIHAADLNLVGRLVTPPFTPTRFDTSFFHAHLPPGQTAEVWPGELSEGVWTTAEALLNRWSRGELHVSPPTLSLLESVCGRPLEDLAERLAPLLADLESGAIPTIYFAPGVQMIPLRTLALPPSTHTNAFLVGQERLFLFDPGPKEAGEQQRLFAALDAARFRERGAAIVLTHHHPDHIGAATVCAERYQVPLWAHPLTAEVLKSRVPIHKQLQEGDRISLGTAPDGTPGWGLEVLHTPGHAPGHLAFYDPHYRLLFAADMVSTLSSIVIAPPEGDLAVYLGSLRRLLSLDCRMLLPSHGGPTLRVRHMLEEAIAHRQRREDQLLSALKAESRSLADLAADLYRGLPSNLRRLAELQTEAGLLKVEAEGRVERKGDLWQIRAEPAPTHGV